MRFLTSYFLLAVFPLLLPAQPRQEYVQILIEPDHADWRYEPGQEASFAVRILRGGSFLQDQPFRYEVGPEQMPPGKEGDGRLSGGRFTIESKGLDVPGFLRCTVETEVEGKSYRHFTTVAYVPEAIEPVTTLPDDFRAFWRQEKEKLAAIPVEPELTLLPERCTDRVDVFHVRLRNIEGFIYGILAMPRAPGRYPALLNVPGAGIRPYYGDVERAERGIITLQIGIHGLPVNLDQEVYQALGQGALKGWPQGYPMTNLDDRQQYYFRRVYLGCVRAVDFLTSLPEYDGNRLAVTGGSQGGALSIVTAGLDERISYLGAFYPALCDLTGYQHGRAGGWPHLFKPGYSDWTITEAKIETSKYYDVVNFARFVQAPGLYSWGYNDPVCPPTTMYAAYNVIEAPKELMLFKDTQHWTYPEQRERMNAWLFERLGVTERKD